MRVLMCYATTEGQTRKIAEFAAGIIGDAGHEAALFDATEITDRELSRCSAAILAGSVHAGRYQTAIVHRIRRWHEALNAMPSAFISVSLSAASSDSHERAEIDECMQVMLRETGWHPDTTLLAAGAFRFTEYDFFKRWVMRLIAHQKRQQIDPHGDTELTDWEALRAFVEAFLERLPAGKPV
jgi:menaquinone-dependent protoporphyrinogen oxidase